MTNQEKEYLIFCDESDKKGKFYSNFYGGLIIGSSKYEAVIARIKAKKAELNLFQEVKWKKVTENYLDKYVELMSFFFSELRAENFRVRIMFRQSASEAVGLTSDQRDLEYFILYYQFIKHAFGLEYSPIFEPSVNLRLYFDQFPDTKENTAQFKGYLLGLQQNYKIKSNNILIREENITEVRSHDHELLQCLDVVLGAMAFRLNDKHLDKPEGANRRGKRTRAKEKLYRVILNEIKTIHTGFNVGISTKTNPIELRWSDPYLHWKFVPANMKFDQSKTKLGQKRKKKDNPI